LTSDTLYSRTPLFPLAPSRCSLEGFTDGQPPPVELLPIEALDGARRLVVQPELDKAEAARFASLTLRDDDDIGDSQTALLEMTSKRLLRRLEGDVPNK